MRPIGLLRQHSSTDSKTSAATTSFTGTKHVTEQRQLTSTAATGDHSSASPSLAAGQQQSNRDDVHFTFTPGALEALTRQPDSPVDEDRKNV